MTINLGNTNGAFVTNLITDGTVTAATFSGALPAMSPATLHRHGTGRQPNRLWFQPVCLLP